MFEQVQFDPDLIRRYDQTGPRYTSYPTAVSFSDTFTEADYRQAAEDSNGDPIPGPLSLYFHIPFCDTLCFYCACNKIATKNHSRAERYLTYLFRELEMQSRLYDPDRVVDQLHLGGGTPTFLSLDEMEALLAMTRAHFHLRDDDRGDYSIEIDPRSVTPDDILGLRRLGFNRFSLGVQDFDPKVQQAVNRIQPFEMTRDIVAACRAAGARSINIDLIYGLPFQNLERFERTLDRVLELQPDRLSVFNYAHLPELFAPQRRIRAADLPAPAVKLEILKRTIQRLGEAGYVYVGMDHFAKPEDELVQAQRAGQLHRNFQGYTTHGDCDLVAMGVSSISMVGDVYAQNEKDMAAYEAALDRGRLPIARGIRLTAEDRLRRDVIHRLICDFALDFADIEDRWGISFPEHFAAELADLRPMQEDGLVTVTERGIRVLPRGRLMVRNVCMVFDERLRQGSQQRRFSRVL